MASKQFLDGIPPEEGVKYQLVTGVDNRTSITNVTDWVQEPTELRANDVTQGMVLECDHTKSGTVHKLTNPNSNLAAIRFTATADYVEGDTFEVNGIICAAQTPDGIKLTSGCFVSGSTVFCIRSENALYFYVQQGEDWIDIPLTLNSGYGLLPNYENYFKYSPRLKMVMFSIGVTGPFSAGVYATLGSIPAAYTGRQTLVFAGGQSGRAAIPILQVNNTGVLNVWQISGSNAVQSTGSYLVL